MGCDCDARYGMRYMAKTMHAALSAHYPNAPEKDILKVCLTSSIITYVCQNSKAQCTAEY